MRNNTRGGRPLRLGLVTGGVLATTVLVAACSSSGNSSASGGSGGSGGGGGSKVGVSLILKTLSNPYFVSMEKDAKSEAAKVNVRLTVAAGKTDGDTQSQIS